MKSSGGVFGFMMYIAGLALLIHFDHIVWFIFGIFIPIIPWVYTGIIIVDKLTSM
ncbi:MAG TPA: hypothetical protein VEP90_17790 [Methylomirabilota bacterium]|nr:hypothetical protein [Methylomirabilota bacterium]